jgi:hypothetical protein
MKYQWLLVKGLKFISQDHYLDLLPEYERMSQMLTESAKSLE